MADPAGAFVEMLNRNLWGGVFGTDEAVIPGEKGAVKKRFDAYVKSRLDQPELLPFRRHGKKGPGALDATRMKSVFAAWARGLEGELERFSREGVVLSLPVAGTTKRVYALRPQERARVELLREIGALGPHVEGLRRQADRLEALAGALSPAQVDARPAHSDDGQVAALRRAYDRHDTSRHGDVPIHMLRTEVGWERSRFDAVLARLRGDMQVELHVGSPTDYSADEVMNSYVEDDGTVYLTVSWRKGR